MWRVSPVVLLVDSTVLNPASRMEWEGRKTGRMSVLTNILACSGHSAQSSRWSNRARLSSHALQLRVAWETGVYHFLFSLAIS